MLLPHDRGRPMSGLASQRLTQWVDGSQSMRVVVKDLRSRPAGDRSHRRRTRCRPGLERCGGSDSRVLGVLCVRVAEARRAVLLRPDAVSSPEEVVERLAWPMDSSWWISRRCCCR